MKGLKKDHQRLTDLLFTHLHTMQHTLTTLLETLSTIYPEHSGECDTLLSSLSTVHVTDTYLLTLSSTDSDLLPLIHTLESKLLPLDTEVLTLLSTLPDTSYLTEFSLLATNIKPIMEKYTTFIKHCDYMTQFNASPYSGADVMIVGFDNYDESYDTLLEQLYEFGGMLDDWTEGLVKSPMWEDQSEFVEDEDSLFFAVDGVNDTQECPNFGIGVF